MHSSRRHPIACLAVVLALVVIALPAEARRRAAASPAPPFDAAWTQGGYADRTSVVQGGNITFHIATTVTPFRLSIVNLANPTQVIRQVDNLTSREQNCSGRYRIGCGWAATTTMNVPASWPSGYYGASFPTAFGERWIMFVVRSANPGRSTTTLLVSPTNTYQAYNAFGGRNLYPSADDNRASHLSFDRPYHENAGLGRFTVWEDEFVTWMASESRTVDVATDNDLEDPTLLGNYGAVLFVGHSEYWTAAARRNLETYVANGGHVAIFSGNTMWWQVRLEESGRLLVGWKEPTFDPALNTNEELVTVHWWDEPIYDPENRIIGSSFRHGGYSNRIGDTFEMLPLEQRIGYTVTDPTSWVFAGANVSRGTTFGALAAGLEVDGVLFNCDVNGNIAGAEGSTGTPLNFRILATTPASGGHGVIGYYTTPSGGAVFNAGTQNWSYGLGFDPVVTTITRNVLDRFASGGPLPYEPVTSSILVQDTFNCPHPTETMLPGWRGTLGEAKASARCAYEGRAGLDLSGTGKILLARNFTPTNVPLEHVESRLYVKLDDFQKRGRFPTPIFTLQYREHGLAAVRQAAYVEVDVVDGAKAVRVARRDSAGAFAASEWTTLPNGWHLIEMSWRSPGAIVLKIDEAVKSTIENPDATQVANEIVVDFPRAETGDGGFACVDAIAAGTEALGSVPGIR